jgi:uncharacterized protein YndB with AHSA1/START domain
MEQTTEKTTVERELAIDASPETVWGFLTDPDKVQRWWGQSVSFDPRPGGEFVVVVSRTHTTRGEFVELDPPRRLVYTWGWETGPPGQELVPPGSTTVEIDLEPSGAGTKLRFRHSGLPNAEAAQAHAEGWDHYLGRLTVTASGGDPGPDPWATPRE